MDAPATHQLLPQPSVWLQRRPGEMDAPATHQLLPQPSVWLQRRPGSSRIHGCQGRRRQGVAGIGQLAGVSVAVRGGGGMGARSGLPAPGGHSRGRRPPALPYTVRRQRPQAPRLTLRLVRTAKEATEEQGTSIPLCRNLLTEYSRGRLYIIMCLISSLGRSPFLSTVPEQHPTGALKRNVHHVEPAPPLQTYRISQTDIQIKGDMDLIPFVFPAADLRREVPACQCAPL